MSERYRIVKASSLNEIDYLQEIDQLYEFPDDDSLALWKVVRTIDRLDQFRSFIISNVRWDKAALSVSINKRRAIYVSFPWSWKLLTVKLLDHYTRLCLPWGHNVPWFQNFSSDNNPWCYDELLDCLSTDDVMSMRVVESIMEQQVVPRVAGPEFDFSKAWAEFVVSRGFEFFLRIIERPVSYRKFTTLPTLPPPPWDLRNFRGARHLYLSHEVYELLRQAVQTPGSPEVLIRRYLERQDRSKEDSSDGVRKTQFNGMWKVWL